MRSVLFFGAGVLIAGKILYLQYGPKGDALRSRGATITYAREIMDFVRPDSGHVGPQIRTPHGLRGARPDRLIFYRDVDSLALCSGRLFPETSKTAYKQMLVEAHRNKAKNHIKRDRPPPPGEPFGN